MVDADITTEGLVLIQKDDLADLADAYQALELPLGWRFVATLGESQGDKIREVHPIIEGADWVGLIGDDQVVKTEAWDRKLMSHLTGWNVVTCNDNWIFNAPTKFWGNGRFAGSPIFSGDLVRALGWIFLPETHQIFLDDTWEELGHLTGCWTRVADVLVEHNHFENGRAPRDETYAKGYDHYARIDIGHWQHWRDHGCAQDAEKIRALKARLGG